MEKNNLSRRQFIATTSIGAIGAIVTTGAPSCGELNNVSGKLAMLGGSPVRTADWLEWPIWDPDADEPMVQRLKAAGAIVVGKTNTPEFGLAVLTENKLGDACRNPWNTEMNTGGSSGGAAASVAAGITSLAQSSDGGGSTRIPACFCGVR